MRYTAKRSVKEMRCCKVDETLVDGRPGALDLTEEKLEASKDYVEL